MLIALLISLHWLTGAFVLSWTRWYYGLGPEKLWQRMLEEALWPISIPWGTYKHFSGKNF